MYRLLCVVLLLAVPACLFAQGIEVFKDVDVAAAPAGYEVTYTVMVENVSAGVLSLDYVNDTLFGDITGWFSPELHPGVTETAEFPYVIQDEDPDPLYNSVDFAYVDESGAPHVDDAQATVDILHPSITYTFECPTDPPPPPGFGSVVLRLYNGGDVAMDLMAEGMPDWTEPFRLGPGESLMFFLDLPCEGDLACWTWPIVADFPPEYGISFPYEIFAGDCCPCAASPVEESTWGVIKATYR